MALCITDSEEFGSHRGLKDLKALNASLSSLDAQNHAVQSITHRFFVHKTPPFVQNFPAIRAALRGNSIFAAVFVAINLYRF
jgi:hypothetical protein